MSTDNRTQLNDCEDDSQSFLTTGGALGTNSLDGNLFEGAASVEFQHSDAYEDTYTNGDSDGVGFNLDLSDSTFYLLVKDNGLDVTVNAGAMIVLGDGTDRIGYTTGGNDAVGLPLGKQFLAFKLDVSVVVATPGVADVDHHVFAGSEANLDQTQVTITGYGSLHSAKAQGNAVNAFIDSFTYIANGSYALTINGGSSGTPETMADVVGDDETSGWGMVANPIGSQYQFFAPTEWGESGAAADHYFEATDEQWYWLGNNAGGHEIGATHFPFRVIGNAADTGSFVLTRVTIVNVGARAQFDVSSTDMDTLTFDGCVFTELGTITFAVQDAGNKYANTCVFNNCDQCILSSLDMDGCTFNGSANADGAILWDENTTDPGNQDNLTFNSAGAGHAIEVAPAGAGPFSYSITGYTFDGFAGQSGTDTDRVFYLNPAGASVDITINLTDSAAVNVQGGGEGFSYRRAAGYTGGTVVIQQTVNVNVQVNDSDGNGITGVRVRVEKVSDGSLVVEGTTPAGGLFTDTYVYPGDTPVLIKCRLKGYKPFRTNDTLTSSGVSATAPMQQDRIVDLP